MTRPTYPNIPLVEDRAIHAAEDHQRYGLKGAITSLADYTGLRMAHTYHNEAEPLTTAQALAICRWIHDIAHHLPREQP